MNSSSLITIDCFGFGQISLRDRTLAAQGKLDVSGRHVADEGVIDICSALIEKVES